MKKINFLFLGSARCFHTEDWYYCAKTLEADNNLSVHFVYDQFEGEGQKTFLQGNDSKFSLINIDKLLPNSVSTVSNKWRNVLKLLLLPVQAIILRRILSKFDGPVIIHAHSTYYGCLASFTGAKYISTPQGSEVLVRLKSFLYSHLARRAHTHANFVTVDSAAMKAKLNEFLGLDSYVIQNGINVDKLSKYRDFDGKYRILSMRGIAPNYRILEILAQADSIKPNVISVCCPFVESDYYSNVLDKKAENVLFLEQLDRVQFHDVLRETKVVISIPESDSSPRSVYEAIFSGAIAICTSNRYVDDLPLSMRRRIVLVDIQTTNWLLKALHEADVLLLLPFEPCDTAVEMYDQMKSMQKIIRLAKEVVYE